jgi:hypothetical protein
MKDGKEEGKKRRKNKSAENVQSGWIRSDSGGMDLLLRFTASLHNWDNSHSRSSLVAPPRT